MEMKMKMKRKHRSISARRWLFGWGAGLFLAGNALAVAPGDVDDSRSVALSDAIRALQVVSGLAPLPAHSESDVDGDGRIGLAETAFILQVVADLRNLRPEGAIDAPSSDPTISVGDSIFFSGSGEDLDGDLPLQFRWVFGEGSGIPDDETAQPGNRVFNSAGLFDVALTVSDAEGAADPTPPLRSVQVTDGLLDRSGWTIAFVDSQETNAEDGGADNILDGDSATYWHTRWRTADPPYPPHEVQIDMGAYNEVTGFRYLPRQDGGTNGRVADFLFSVSDDRNQWTTVAGGIFPNNGFEQEVRFDGITARYLRLEALGEINDGPYTTIAELNVLGAPFSDNRPPDGTILEPVGDASISLGETVFFEGSGLDPDGNAPLRYAWDFGADSDIAPSNLASPGSVVFETPGLFTASLTVIDALGRPDPRPAERIVRVLDAGADPTIAPSAWRVVYVDSEETAAEDGRGRNAIDGDPNTIWHTEYSLAQPEPPHEIQIDLGSAYQLSGFRYLPRQDASVNGTIRDYLFYVSRDGREWGGPVASGGWPDDQQEKAVLFAPTFGQFVRLVALSEVNNKEYTAAAEIQVEGRCETPYVHLLEPAEGAVEPSQNLTARASACLNPSTHPGWSVEFRLDGGARSAVVSGAPFEHSFNAVSYGEHSVEVRILNDQGTPVSGENVAHEVAAAVGDYLVAIGDSITAGVGDDAPEDDVSRDGRNLEGGFTPILSDLLATKRSRPVFIAMEGVPGITSATGLERLPAVLSEHPKAESYLILFGTNDANQTPSVPPEDFKANLQGMIDLIAQSGAEPFLAKVPYSLKTSINSAIELYNQKIDELAAENALSVVPPDFYGFFENNQNLFSDSFHPDGIGYQNMASLWSAVLP
jgi:lysophospholipase L1-like esterase